MTPYSKMSQTAIAAASVLAEVYNPVSPVKLSSADIAQRRQLPQPVVAKVLTILSQAELVHGSPGPGGGYWLARKPREVSLYDVVSQFERVDENTSCPFGTQYCGVGPQCPLHADLAKLRDQLARFLRKNTLAAFVLPVASIRED